MRWSCRPTSSRRIAPRLSLLQRKLCPESPLQVLEQNQAEFEVEVGTYNGKITRILRSCRREIKEIVELVREATAGTANCNSRYDTEFKQFASGLEKTVQCQDLREIRLRLTRHVADLRASIDQMRADHESILRPLQAEIQSYAQRLARAEQLASRDPLTGLFNRREAERSAEEKMKNGIPFCVVIIDLNRFKGINDRFGHSCGDQVLKLFAMRLERQVRARDVVCRWGGDEFVIIMECKLSDAMQRSRALAESLRSRFAVPVNGHTVELEVNISVGIAQGHPGESLEATFERADGMLYQMKRRA